MLATVLIVDDSEFARKAIRLLLTNEPFHICGEAKDGMEAIEQTKRLKPDVVLLDINMPVMNGIQAAVEIRKIAPLTKLVLFTNYDFPAIVRGTGNLCEAFLPKSDAGALLIPTLHRLTHAKDSVERWQVEMGGFD